MSNNVLTFDMPSIRGSDSNSLLRMFDLANDILRKSPLQQERVRADKALQRIAKELRKRKVPCQTGTEQSYQTSY
jgi:hypothetical protein